MSDWDMDPQEQKPAKKVDEIISGLVDQVAEVNMRYATDEIQHDEWSAEMRSIDQKLAIFGLRLDRPERFTRMSGRL